MPEELDVPDLPEALAYIWQWFIELQGHERLTHLEIDAWARLNKIEITPFELSVIWLLERIRISH